MRWPAALLAVLLALPAIADQSARFAAQELAVSKRVTLAGVLDESAFDRLAELDATVVELRTAPEGIEAERRALISRGVHYVHLPVGGKPFAREDVLFLGRILDARPERPVVVHCASGNRAAALWGALRLERGAALQDVLEEVAPIATKEPTRETIRKYAAQLKE